MPKGGGKRFTETLNKSANIDVFFNRRGIKFSKTHGMLGVGAIFEYIRRVEMRFTGKFYELICLR
jgi:hypothetical protein